jgi:hypothetical protein
VSFDDTGIQFFGALAETLGSGALAYIRDAASAAREVDARMVRALVRMRVPTGTVRRRGGAAKVSFDAMAPSPPR